MRGRCSDKEGFEIYLRGWVGGLLQGPDLVGLLKLCEWVDAVGGWLLLGIEVQVSSRLDLGKGPLCGCKALREGKVGCLSICSCPSVRTVQQKRQCSR